MTQEELINVFKYIVKKCDMLINNGNYKADAYTQDTVEDIAELCNHIIDGDYGKLIEVKEVDLEKEIDEVIHNNKLNNHRHTSICSADIEWIAEHFFELGLKTQGKETSWKPSKEEMDVLYGVAYITNQYDEHKEEAITRLYQDLKREFFNGSSYENMFPNTEDGVIR